MTSYTPGPWVLETVPTQCGICHKVGPFPPKREGDKPRHACLYADYPSPGNPADDELAANARLIAAAPELLSALEGVLSAWSRLYPSMPVNERYEDCEFREMQAVRAAIEKATGGAA